MKWYATALLALAIASPIFAQPPLELKKGDHICIIGNTLADRMQHDGWLEAYIQARFPQHELVFRNLGFSGDEVAGFTDQPNANFRMRSQSFGSADQWLAGSAPVPEPNRLTTRIGVRDNRFETTNTKADVIFAFFGYNESFADAEGLPKFKKDLAAFIKHTLSQQYNGHSAPRLVLFSPTAHENLNDRNLPDGSENNRRLELYTKAMADVAKAEGVPFVDLFHASAQLVKGGPITIDGVHLNEYGNMLIAAGIDQALFGLAPQYDSKHLEKVRQAVLDKNFYWFNRYRVLDGYNVYGGRAFERYADKQSNYEDQQRELEILDVKTANRDKRVWSTAQSGELQVDDSNCPPLIAVKTNKPGNGPNGEHILLDGEAAIQKMTVAKGMKVTLFASEKEFPELAKPVQMQFDPQGRLWVAVWPSYPHWKPTEEMNDKILIFEDTKGTGKADKVTVFADHLNCPTGFEFFNGGVLVAQAPDLIFLKDTKGTGHADLRMRVLHGLDSADSHHTANSFALDPGGALYFQEGTFHHSQVESPWGPPARCANGGVFRYEPRSQKFEVYVSTPFANPHGHVWDHWGQDIVYDGTGANPYHGALFSSRIDFPAKHPKPPQVYQQRTRPCPGVEILSSRHFPPENQGNLLVANVIFPTQGILQYKVQDNSSSFLGTEVETIVSSTDPNFRPSDLKIGPDGAIWFIDWQNPIIGHLQHAIRDPNRDRTHGRIYRITYEGRELLKPVAIAGEPIEKLLDVLKEPEDRVRYRARIELSGRKSEEVIPAVAKWIAALDPNDANYEHHMLEALWLHQSQNVVNLDLLKRELSCPDFHARAAATRVLCYWRDRVPDALPILKQLAADPHPRVRLEAIRAASFFREPEAIEVPLIAGDFVSDQYLDFLKTETLRVLEPQYQAARGKGEKVNFTTEAGARYMLRKESLEALLKMERTRAVSLELLFRPNVRDEVRRDALRSLAKFDSKAELRVLLDTLTSLDEKKDAGNEGVVFDLVRLLPGRNPAELIAVRANLERLATAAHQPFMRQVGFVMLLTADGNPDKAWALAAKSPSLTGLRDLLAAMPLIADPGLRASLYPKVEPLLHGTVIGSAANGVKGRYVRIELPGKRKTLSLAEVEVYSDGQNIARKGKATQSSTAHGGDAGKAIDGNRSGHFADGGVTHTQENGADPWWQLDLGGEYSIDSIAIYNRADGLGGRLAGFTLVVKDAAGNTLFEKPKQPAPDARAEYLLASEPAEQQIRAAAMTALTSVRGEELKTFQTLSRFVETDAERTPAIRAIQRIPRSYWPKDDAPKLLEPILASIKKMPVAQRTTPAALEALEFADALASFLAPEQAKKVRAELGELGVRVVRINTLPERMAYDKEVIAVKAGKPVEFLLENSDLMPHNFVITQPGAMEEIGKLAEASATEPDAAARHFVPRSNKILLAGTLLQPRATERLSFMAPTAPGVYPYVCTYPGHWLRMHGALYVVDDLDAYQANPEAYLAAHPLPIRDELLKDRRPRTEWKFDDLVGAVAQMKSGRRYDSGKHLFQVATCVACHKLDGVGNEFGPDLAKLEPKLTPTDILKDILEPSAKINEKYQSFVIELKNGTNLTGLILEKKNGVLKVIENPLASTKVREIKESEIEGEPMKSPVSMMPKGLLDKLTREEILDLLAYLASRGDKGHPLFKGDTHEHHH